MPAPETSDLIHTALLWSQSGFDNDGQPKVASNPEEIRCRWVTRSSQQRDDKGNKISVDATVTVDRAVKIGSAMWRGSLESWSGTGSAAGDETEIMQVVTSRETSDVKGRETTRKVGLVFFRDSLPNQE